MTIVSNSAQLNAAFPLAIPAGFRESDSGGRFRLEFGGLREIQPIALARAFEAAEALGCRAVDGILSVEADGLSVAFATRLPGRSRIGLNPSWLDPVTGPRAVVGGALALETGGPSLEAAFALADRVEKVDPTRAGVAPLRTRLNLLAAAARAQPEADLWPHLKGLSGGVLVSPDGQVSGALIGLHTSSAEAAGRIARVVLPRLAAAYLGGKAPAGDSKVEIDDAIPLGKIDGRPLRAQLRGATVWVGWGEHALDECTEAEAHPERSQARAWLRAPGGQVLQRAGAFWPGRTWEMALPGSPRTKALAEAPPVVWLGHTDGPVARDVIRWTGLSEVVRRWLDALPLESPPDKAGPG